LGELQIPQPPDFLWNLVALADFIRLSKKKQGPQGFLKSLRENPKRNSRMLAGAPFFQTRGIHALNQGTTLVVP
jgi:hypothetical protein